MVHGVHGRRQAGPGETFWQFRRYQPGDLASLIDWRQSARSRHLYVREREWEAAQSIWLWHDDSPSMDYRSRGVRDTKAARATLLLLATAALLLRGGEVSGSGPRGRILTSAQLSRVFGTKVKLSQARDGLRLALA